MVREMYDTEQGKEGDEGIAHGLGLQGGGCDYVGAQGYMEVNTPLLRQEIIPFRAHRSSESRGGESIDRRPTVLSS